VGWKRFNAIYETPTIVLVINFVRRRLSASIGLVRHQRRACYAADPQNDWNEFRGILKRHSRSLEVKKQEVSARYPKAERRMDATGHARWVRNRVRLILDARPDDAPAASDICGPIL